MPRYFLAPVVVATAADGGEVVRPKVSGISWSAVFPDTIVLGDAVLCVGESVDENIGFSAQLTDPEIEMLPELDFAAALSTVMNSKQFPVFINRLQAKKVDTTGLTLSSTLMDVLMAILRYRRNATQEMVRVKV